MTALYDDSWGTPQDGVADTTTTEQVREAWERIHRASRLGHASVYGDLPSTQYRDDLATIDRFITAATAPTAEWDEAIAYFTEGHAVMERQKGVPLPKGRAALATLTAIHTADRSEVERLRAGLRDAIRVAESWIHDQLDGTGSLDSALAELNEARAALSAEGES